MPDSSPLFESADDAANDEGTGLQFDHAELTTPVSAGPSCDVCKRPISDAYYEINGKVLCTSCRQRIEESLRGGSGLARFITAVVLGTGAAIVGALLYFIVTRVTGWNIGLVAIVVGFMVGGAVRKGTGNRGGMLYQFLSVLLTYFAIGLMGLSFFLEDQFKGAKQRKEQPKAIPAQAPKEVAKAPPEPKAPAVAANDADLAKGIARPKQPPRVDAPPKAEKAEKAGIPVAEKKKNDAIDEAEKVDFVDLKQNRLALAIFFAFIIIAGPVILSVQAPISGLIYCFALWQAWQMNKRAKIVFNGPFQVGKSKPTAAGSEVDDVG